MRFLMTKKSNLLKMDIKDKINCECGNVVSLGNDMWKW